MAKPKNNWLQHPSWWVVIISGALLLTFSVAIVRELINGHEVRQQVQRLQHQVATEQQRQAQLQDLIDYLGSPTFQEQEARLKLGLKKTGEQVIVVPTTNTPVEGGSSDQTQSGTASDRQLSNPERWWKYFFGPTPTTSSTNA